RTPSPELADPPRARVLLRHGDPRLVAARPGPPATPAERLPGRVRLRCLRTRRAARTLARTATARHLRLLRARTAALGPDPARRPGARRCDHGRRAGRSPVPRLRLLVPALPRRGRRRLAHRVRLPGGGAALRRTLASLAETADDEREICVLRVLVPQRDDVAVAAQHIGQTRAHVREREALVGGDDLLRIAFGLPEEELHAVVAKRSRERSTGSRRRDEVELAADLSAPRLQAGARLRHGVRGRPAAPGGEQRDDGEQWQSDPSHGLSLDSPP